MNAQDIVALETVFDQYVAHTPRILEWTANDVAADAGTYVEEASAWLQGYKEEYIRGNTMLRYVIGTTNRGPDSLWLFLTFPGMTNLERRSQAQGLTVHLIKVEIKEHVMPWVRTYLSEIVPALNQNPNAVGVRAAARENCRGHIRTLRRLRADLAGLRDRALQRAAAPYLATIDFTVAKLRQVEQAL